MGNISQEDDGGHKNPPVEEPEYGAQRIVGSSDLQDQFLPESEMVEVKGKLLEKRGKMKPNIFYIFSLSTLHLLCLYGVKVVATEAWQWKTAFLGLFMTWFGVLGITVAAHRYWAHRTFKAKFPLRVLLILMNTASGQESVWWWSANHRVHHKFSDTDGDPHNSRRGFWYSHIGWMFTFDEERFNKDLKHIDMTDLDKDWLVQLQKKYYWHWVEIFSIMIPTWIPWYFWGETLWASYILTTGWRTLFVLHATLSVNSFAHMFGNKPFDKNIPPGDNLLAAIFLLGEGWHNFHHAFPWDYRSSEYGFYRFNPSGAFIDFMAWLGQAYDLKTASGKVIEQRAKRTGDGSYVKYDSNKKHSHSHSNGHSHSHGMDTAWGWGDKDIPKEYIMATDVLYPSKERDL